MPRTPRHLSLRHNSGATITPSHSTQTPPPLPGHGAVTQKLSSKIYPISLIAFEKMRKKVIFFGERIQLTFSPPIVNFVTYTVTTPPLPRHSNHLHNHATTSTVVSSLTPTPPHRLAVTVTTSTTPPLQAVSPLPTSSCHEAATPVRYTLRPVAAR